ncbi:hypothetical protein DY000_02041237 [Brassica cretica]|uniref:Uncharacterized protein n=1 Tax=Brassica cretica TaxID=69181 RepID=A0ABQ7BKI2_BRACR|nr:hypothetical protein DY000_02041237 [Brassica cretica]
MHGLMLYRRFGRARSLRSDRAERRYVATELVCGSSVMTELGSSVFRSSYSDLSVTGLDILVFCGDLDVNFVVTVFNPNRSAEMGS